MDGSTVMKEYHYMNVEYLQLLEWTCQPSSADIAMRDNSTKPDLRMVDIQRMDTLISVSLPLSNFVE